MKIKGPESPFQASTEPLDQQQPADLWKVARGEFADALSQLETAVDPSNPTGRTLPSSETYSETKVALREIARKANLSNVEEAATAVRESAEFMIRSRLAEKSRDSTQGQKLVASLSEYVATDPLLKPKLLSILKRIKPD
jgi:hypothetical protein